MWRVFFEKERPVRPHLKLEMIRLWRLCAVLEWAAHHLFDDQKRSFALKSHPTLRRYAQREELEVLAGQNFELDLFQRLVDRRIYAGLVLKQTLSNPSALEFGTVLRAGSKEQSPKRTGR